MYSGFFAEQFIKTYKNIVNELLNKHNLSEIEPSDDGQKSMLDGFHGKKSYDTPPAIIERFTENSVVYIESHC